MPMRTVACTAGHTVVWVWIAASPLQGQVRLLEDHASSIRQTSGRWVVRQGVLKPTDLSGVQDHSGDVGTVFFSGLACEDFTLTCEFCIPKGSTGAGGPSLYFRCTGTNDYTVVHLINAWNNISVTRARPGEFETELAHHMGAPLREDAWHRLRIHAGRKRVQIALDDKTVVDTEDEPREGIIGLGARVREVRYRDVQIHGAVTRTATAWAGRPPTRHAFIVCRDSGHGGYEAFPGLVRLENGDLLAAFYSGWTHVSRPGDSRRPNGGRICAARSSDDGGTWSRAVVIGDTRFDDRDPSVWQGKDGTVHCVWPAADWPKYSQSAKKNAWCHAFRVRSSDNGRTWSDVREWLVGQTLDWTVWTAPRLLSDGSWLMPVYKNCTYTSAAMIRSLDDGRTWSPPTLLDESNKRTDEPDIVELPGRRLLCIMRPAGGVHAWQSWSNDLGKTWTRPASLDWHAHSPNVLRTSRGVLLCGHRDPGTSIHYSFDDGKTWAGMVMIDSCGGAYPCMTELPDGRVLIVYYTEGRKSDIRGQFLAVSREGVRPIAAQ